ncbi:MAG: hypothetical protein K8L91_18575 [Anaerolineae bacterium]|nr:hypothetical protein [Anaerolineae bacterium]
MATHLWHLTFDEDVPDQLSELGFRDRMAIFHSIKELLEAENPSALTDVRKLLEKRHLGLWRKRQGDYRILFTISAGQIEHQNFVYKGMIHIVAVVHRSKAY